MNEINKSRMKLSQIRALVAVADYGNFSEAALQLEVSQSAISHAIASFEEELGVVLLARGRYGARLTPVGERVTAHARKLLQLLEAMEKEANLEKGLQGGNVRVACFRSVATHILPTAIARFRACFPNITVSIVDGDDYSRVGDALRAGYADIGFIYLPAGNEFETWEILRDDYVLLLPPTTNLSSAKVTWKQLATYPLIISSGIPCNEWIRKYLVIAEYPLNIAYEIKEDSTIVSMVEQGLGAAILPRLAAEPVPTGVRVCSLPAPLERVIGVAVLANALHTPAVYAFLDAIRNTGRFAAKAAV
ncbi:LysR family transcriptional regulator [Coleofasciculus sp. FACHB-T130]|uniref:LysR family transcriptional regulator n=1 Tax=Cyanophyceae TaxID=3028117 RepID=UPI001686D05B|nr:LysR family transcriptional regulator [Coleofasciculus sp. FACHB-T130]MBD1878010.1 LysR family transcriptional regulator [Coleofasciculus sp. FACHB-T130]